ncbi:DUF2577 domain-containing protein [Paenibacillus sp. SYP-B4298]|uniref:DUF2577 domain-containing protein n=1 Tax=Paenibacillus sp. SYP-B4298 TaxID=2996034 RepID=UPI0022DD41B5|nr:DUF2577 domain-containing protein [Paenibacillus sp. SYP-B4298]
MSLVDMIKQIGLGAMDAQQPVTVLFASVTNINPLEVSAGPRMTLPEDFLIVPENLKEQKLQIGSTEYIIRKPLQKGDRVALLRVQGGLSYYVLDRVVDGG